MDMLAGKWVGMRLKEWIEGIGTVHKGHKRRDGSSRAVGMSEWKCC